MIDELKKKLDDKNDVAHPSPFHAYLRGLLVGKVNASRGVMSRYYGEWDANRTAYSSRKITDKDDAEALKVGLPSKVALPLSYAQVNVFVAFLYGLFTQRERFYEFTAIESEDHKLREYCELVVQQNMLRNRSKEKLFQNLLNVGRFGLGVEIDYWTTQNEYVPVQSMGTAQTIGGVAVEDAPLVTSIQRVTKFEGTCIETVSPYRFFPDASVDLHEWRNGSYVAWESEWTVDALKQLEREGIVYGVDRVKPLDAAKRNLRGRADQQAVRYRSADMKTYDEGKTICVTQCVWKVAAASVTHEGVSLGPENEPMRWLFWIANDDRVIRAEPLPNVHCDWPVSVSMFAPDMHDELMTSLSTVSRDIQSLVAWLLNSRMAAVSRTVDCQFIADPTGINLDDLKNRYRVIRMQKTAVNRDIRRMLQQVQVTDTTTGHVGDMSTLTGLMQMVTGINDNVTGQYHSGRRSAAESRVVTNASASRVKLVGDLMWAAHYQPQANRVLTNARQALSEEMFVRLCGKESQASFQAFRSTPEQLAAQYDYVVFDGTLPSDKQFMAQQLMEVFGMLISNPTASAAFNMDPNRVFQDVMRLRGFGSGTQYGFEQMPETLIAALAMQQGQQQPAPTPPTV